MNPPQGDAGHQGKTPSGSPFNEHDVKRRQGGFEQAGEHARTGNRGRR